MLKLGAFRPGIFANETLYQLSYTPETKKGANLTQGAGRRRRRRRSLSYPSRRRNGPIWSRSKLRCPGAKGGRSSTTIPQRARTRKLRPAILLRIANPKVARLLRAWLLTPPWRAVCRGCSFDLISLLLLGLVFLIDIKMSVMESMESMGE